jgi:putative oxidoreductase
MMYQSATPTALSRPAAVVAWTLQLALAGMFLFSGWNKLIGAPMMVQLFETIGFGQWFRYFTGTIEVAGAIGLLVPRLAPLAALMLGAVMIGAMITHLVIGASPALPIGLFVALGAVVYLRRNQLPWVSGYRRSATS